MIWAAFLIVDAVALVVADGAQVYSWAAERWPSAVRYAPLLIVFWWYLAVLTVECIEWLAAQEVV